MRICDSIQHESKSAFPFQYNIIFETYQSFEPRSSTLEGDRHVRPLIFCKKFNPQQLLFETFFLIMHIFGSVEP